MPEEENRPIPPQEQDLVGENSLWKSLWQQPNKGAPDFVEIPPNPSDTSQPAIPHYPKGDTSAALLRLAIIRAKERMALKVSSKFVASTDDIAARWKPVEFRAISSDVGAPPSRPAEPGIRPKGRAVVNLHSSLGCRFPIGDPAHPDFRYCRAPRRDVISPYCECHHNLCYRGFPRI